MYLLKYPKVVNILGASCSFFNANYAMLQVCAMTSCFRGHTHLDSDKLLVMSIVVLILCVVEGEEPQC